MLLIPARVFGLTKIHNDISRSLTFAFFHQLIPDHLPAIDHFQNTWRVLNDPTERQAIESSPEYKAVSEDNKIQSILTDQDLLEQIHRGEMDKVLGNPKIQEIFQDKELLKKFLALESSLLNKEPPRDPN